MVVIERGDENKFREGLVPYYTSLGFTMKVEPTVDVLERLEFCQTRPVNVNGQYRMIRNLHQSMAKDLHSLQDLQSDMAASQWLDAVGKGGRVMNDGVPVLKAFFKQFPVGKTASTNSDLSVHLQDAFAYKFNREAKFMDAPCSPETRYSFWLAFGLTPDEQVALERGFEPIIASRILEDIEEVSTLLQWSRA